MLKQILAKLEVKFPGLSKVFLGLIATQLATKVTEESGIDAALAELDNAPISITTLATEFQKEGDRRVTEAKQKFDKANPKKDEPADPAKPEPSDPPKKDDEPPVWAKTLLDKVTKLEGEKQQSTIRTTIAAKLKDKVPDIVWNKRPLPGKEEEIDAFIQDVEADFKTYTETSTDKNLSVLGVPRGGTGGAGDKKASEKEVEDIVKNIM